MEAKYAVNIFWSEEDASFVATFPDFPYLSAFGDTWEEALADARIVLDMTLESMAEDGVEPPRPAQAKRKPEREFRRMRATERGARRTDGVPA